MVDADATQVGAGISIDWSSDALAVVRDAVIEAYKTMGITLDVDERLQVHTPLFSKWV